MYRDRQIVINLNEGEIVDEKDVVEKYLVENNEIFATVQGCKFYLIFESEAKYNPKNLKRNLKRHRNIHEWILSQDRSDIQTQTGNN